MSAAAKSQQSILEGLRARIQELEARPARRAGAVATGRAAVDALLGGGFPCGALSEIAGGPASGKTALALSAVAGAEGTSAWVDGRGELFPPAARALGVDLARLLIVRPGTGDRRDALWASEALLACGAFAVVVMDLAPGATRRGASEEGMLRRLRGAAEQGGSVGLWLAAEPGAAKVPAAVRIEVAEGGARVALIRGGGGRAA